MTIVPKVPKLNNVPAEFWKNRQWYVKRFNWYPFTLGQQVLSILYHPTVKTPFSFTWAGTFCNESAEWYWDRRDQIQIREGILDKAKISAAYTDAFFKNFLGYFKKLEAVFDRAEKENFSKLKNQELFRVLSDLYEAEIGVAAWGYLVDSFLTTNDDNWLEEEIAKETRDRQATQALLAPGFETFVNREEINLLYLGSKIASQTKFRLLLKQPKALLTAIKKDRKLLQLFELHRKKYYWIENNYWVAHNHNLEYFVKKMIELGPNFEKRHRQQSKSVEINLRKKEIIYRRLGLSKKLQNVIYCSDRFGLIQDTRKQAALRLDHFLFLIAEQIAKRCNLTKDEALNLIYPEVEDVLLKGKIDRKELRRRITKCFLYLSPHGYAVISGKAAEKIDATRIFHSGIAKGDQIKGTPAFAGVIRGKVRVVNSHADMKAFKQGEILVTNNTTPEFVPLMKKARAIVTEQGGMTSHAAIVSRELRVTCVVGTGSATRIFKTGDKVEVDANKGVVRKIS